MTGNKTVKQFAYSELAIYLRKKIRQMRPEKSQVEIAIEAGWDQSPNMLSMIANGSSRMPIERVPALARALDIHPSYLLRLTILQHSPELWSIIEEASGMVLTCNEEALLTHIRQMSRNSDPAPSPQLLSALRELLEK